MRQAVVAVVLGVLLAACGGRGGDAVPKPRAYPRVAVDDSVYVAVAGAAMPFEAARAAEVLVDSGGRWLTLSYPSYGAVVYVTLSEASDQSRMAAMIDNRRERMSLNLNGAPAGTTHITSLDGNFEAVLLEAPGTGTPLQFLATDGHRQMVSGVAQLPGAQSAPYDSVRPVLAALRRDIVHALKTLRQ